MRRLGVHGPGLLGRARAERGSLLLAAAVVALATLLAGAVPAQLRTTGDHAVAQAVARAGSDADVVADAPFERDDELTGERARVPESAAEVRQSTDVARYRLGTQLGAVMRPPVASVTSIVLNVTDGSLLRTFRLAYVAGGAGARVVWTSGGPPRAHEEPDGASGPDPLNPRPWPVQVGLSESDAATLGLGPGDRVRVSDARNGVKDVRVSGVFRPADPRDPAWSVVPELLHPVTGADGPGSTRTAGLLSADSLPDARLAVEQDETRCTVVFAPRPERLTLARTGPLATTIAALKASSGSSETNLTWSTGLDGVLRAVRAQAAAATAQASVLLIGLVATAGLLLLLAADLLVRRRAGALTIIRRRGASLAGTGFELLVESAAVAVAGTVVGLLLGRLLAAGRSWEWSWTSSLSWSLPVVLVAALGGPLLGMRTAARATNDRKAPANRSARLADHRTDQVRRAVPELAVLLVTAAAFAALHQRGVLPAGPGEGGGNSLPAAAPTLGAVAGALVLLRLLPLALDRALARAVRSRGGLALIGAARAIATAARPLPFVGLVVSVALLTLTVTLADTESHGQADGAWRSVGADARLDLPVDASPASNAALVRRIAGSPGVRHAVAARVTDDVTLPTDSTTAYARLVVVDAAAFRQLLAGTPLPGAPQLSRLTSGSSGSGTAVPALVRATDEGLRTAKSLSVRSNDTTVRLTPVGSAPAVGDGEGDVVIVDAARFAAAGGSAPPNTVWVTGPGAGAAVTSAAGAGVATLRPDVLRARRTAPLAAGLAHLAGAGAVVLILLGGLAVVLSAAAGAPARGQTLARLRTLGLRRAEARRLTAGELAPPVVAGVVGGALVGLALAYASLRLLSLRLLTGQATDPALVVPWITVGVAAALLLGAVGAVVAVESSLKRRERLGEVLRVGSPDQP